MALLYSPSLSPWPKAPVYLSNHGHKIRAIFWDMLCLALVDIQTSVTSLPAFCVRLIAMVRIGRKCAGECLASSRCPTMLTLPSIPKFRRRNVVHTEANCYLYNAAQWPTMELAAGL